MAKRIALRLAGIIVILAIAYVGSSWYLGQRAETLIHNRVAAYNQQIRQYLPADAPRITLSVDDYQRHVFTSDVRYTLTIASGGDTQEISFAGHLVHGPFPYTEVKRGNFQPLMVASYARLLQTDNTKAMFAARSDKSKSPVTVHTTLTFQGSGQSVWQFQPLATAQSTATFSGGTATVTLANQFQDATLNAEFGGFSINEDDVSLHFQGIGISGETSVAGSGATTSALAISIASMASETRSGQTQATTDTRLAFSGTLAQGLVDGKLEYSVGHMQMGTVDLGGFELVAHVTDVNSRAVRALQKIVTARGGNKQQPSPQVLVRKLLAPQPVFAIDKLRWQTPVGTSSASLNLHFTQPDKGVVGQALPLMLAGAVQRGELHVKLNKPMLLAVLKQSFANARHDAARSDMRAKLVLNEISAILERTGLFVINDAVLKTEISYQDRTFVVNGEKMSVGEFFSHVFALAMTLG